MSHSSDYCPDHRGCVIRPQHAKKTNVKRTWWEAQVQAERTKIELYRSARRKIDEVLDAGDIWRRWATGEMECRSLPLPHNDYI